MIIADEVVQDHDVCKIKARAYRRYRQAEGGTGRKAVQAGRWYRQEGGAGRKARACRR